MQPKPRANEIDLWVGAAIRDERRSAGMTLRELAETIGSTYQQVRKYEVGENRLAIGILHKIACALGVSVASFFAGYEDGAPLQRREPGTAELLRHVARIRSPEQRAAVAGLARALAEEVG